jgi:hypothetical protein
VSHTLWFLNNLTRKICWWKIWWVSRPVDVSVLRNVSLWKHIVKNFLTYSCIVGRAMMIHLIRQEIFQQNFIWLSTDNQNMVCIILKELKVNNIRIITLSLPTFSFIKLMDWLQNCAWYTLSHSLLHNLSFEWLICK